jgi:hypothetical protein
MSSGPGTAGSGSSSQGTQFPWGEDPGAIMPSLGIHSALVFGSTMTVSSIVRKREGQREYDRLVHYLLTGVAIFTAGIIICLIQTVI